MPTVRGGVGLLAILSLATPQPALGNGRVPAPVGLHAGGDRTLVLSTTVGLLLSPDDGETWNWVCENAIGYTGTYDPDYAIEDDGTLWATTYDGIKVSRDGGCTWNPPSGPLAGVWASEVEVGPDGRIWAATESADQDNDVYVSTDGTTFTPTGLSHPGAWWRSLRIAPGDSERIYVSGYVPPQPGEDAMTSPEAILYRSTNGGTSWTQLPLVDISFAEVPSLMIAAVSPTDRDTVYARAVTAGDQGGDVLYRSTNGGTSWTPLLDTIDTITAVVVVGDGRVVAGTINDGVHVSTDGGDTWTRDDQPKMACATRDADGSFLSCGSNYVPDLFALARSTDLTDWTKIMRLCEIDAPLACPAGTVQHDACAVVLWPVLVERIGIGCGAPAGDAGTGPGPGGGGCCDGGGGVASVVLALLLLPLVSRRRRAAG